jgi:hypothetical protein
LFATRSVAAGVLAAALAVPAAGLAATTAPRVLFTLTVSEIDRNGTSVTPLLASVLRTNGVSFPLSGSAAHVPAGTYIVAARVWQPSDGNTQTLVAKKVHVTAATHVTLSAVGAVPVTATVSAAGATMGGQSVSLCLGTGASPDPVTGYFLEPGGTAYVKPLTSPGLQTVYQTYFSGAGGTLYNVAGRFTAGIPGSPAYHAHVASMARVHVQLKSNENVTSLAIDDLSYANCGSISEPVSSLPAVYTDFRTPGAWNTNLNFGSLPSHNQKDLFKSAAYQAGHTYTDIFGSAADGPGTQLPAVAGHHVVFSPANLLDDPVVGTGFDCEGKAAVSLHRGAALVKSQKLAFCGKVTTFSAHVASAGLVTLAATAVRFNPSGSVPGGDLLSTQVSVRWHFTFVPGHAAPVTVTRFVPQGLNSQNGAAGGSTTAVKVFVVRGGGAVPHTVHLQASFDNGVTWHNLTATPHAGFLLTHVHNPASGFVSLRSVVTDTHGNQTTETILRAYLAG